MICIRPLIQAAFHLQRTESAIGRNAGPEIGSLSVTCAGPRSVRK